MRKPPPLVYTAGPYTDPDPWECEQNVRRAEALAREVMLIGAWPICPHSNSRWYFTRTCSYEQAIEGTLEIMRRCDAVIFTPDWGRSKGARGEHEEAVRLGMTRFYSIDELREWLLAEAAQ